MKARSMRKTKLAKRSRQITKVASAENAKLSKEFQKMTEAVRARLKDSLAISSLGFEVERVEPGRAVFRMRVTKRHLQMHGVVHGGILATLADTVAAIAAYTTVAGDTQIATIEMNINFLEAVHSGEIRALARVLRTGRNFVVTECEIRNEDGSLAAKSLLTFGAVADKVAAQLRERD
jgi:uncharacterized protein (TIGR00369 family)